MSYKCNASAVQRGQLLAALAAFLGSQRRLQVLSLENACLGVSEALRLLGAAARCSSATLGDLRLHAAFREWQAPHASPKFSRALRRLSPLSALSLNYPALSDATLVLLAECCGPALRSLSVTVRDTDHRQHALSQEAWTQAAAACPHLRVVLNIEHIGHFEDICVLLLPAVPLCGFRLYSGSVWDQSRSRAFRATLRLLTAHYHQSLECVQLNLKNSREQLDDVVLELLSRCRRLSFFQFDGVLRHLDTVKDICRLRLDASINFQTIHVRPKIANNSIRAAAKDIATAFQEPLSQRTVDFRIEVPAR
ncbi:F-box only protein 39-like [Thrips palmi]|uniref:F-box only protein 39-like n=1 Tax=Thrips palmi TaxID=161013 RepID=A0A6P8YY19_THRPL|nr:F-box only protein 39-like [Thrips palmi]